MPVTNWGRKPNGAEMVQYDAPMFFSFTEHSLLHQYPNMRAECHWHIDFEFTHIIRGHMWYFVNGESIRLEEGQGIFVNYAANCITVSPRRHRLRIFLHFAEPFMHVHAEHGL